MAGPGYRRDHAQHASLPDASRIYLRRLREADLRLGPAFFAALSPRSRYLRLMQQTNRLPPSTLAQLRSQLKDPRCMVLAAFAGHADGAELVGGGRIVPTARREVCEFALTVVDAWQGRGVGRVLLRELTRAARRLGYRWIEGYALPINTGMLKLARISRMAPSPLPADPQLVRLSRRLFLSNRPAH